MRRREFIKLLGATAATSGFLSGAARAQQSGKFFRIGFLGLPTADGLPERTDAFRAGLRELGYQEGRDVVIDYRWANGDYDRLPSLLAELIANKVDVIVTHGTPGAQAARRATTAVPIVVAVVAMPSASASCPTWRGRAATSRARRSSSRSYRRSGSSCSRKPSPT